MSANSIAATDIVERALEGAGSGGRAVIVEDTSVANVRWALSTLTTNGETDTRSVTVIDFAEVADGIATGSATGPVREAGDIAALVAAARRSAEGGSAAQDAAPLSSSSRTSSSWGDPSPTAGAPDLAHLTPALGEVFRGNAQVEYFGYAEHSWTTTHLGLSTGVRLRHAQPATRFELCGKSHSRTRSAWSGAASGAVADIDVANCAASVAQGLAWQANAIDVEPGRHQVILPGSAVADLMIYLYWSASARDAAEGRSVFAGDAAGSTRIGERLCSLPLLLASDPYAADVACADFVVAAGASALSSSFDNGLPIERTEWMREGSLTALPATRHGATMAKIPFAPIVDNLIVDVPGQTGDLAALVADTDDGLLLTCLWYIREVDPQSLLLTGLTRDGVYVVSGGEVVGCAPNFRFNESPVGLLERINGAAASAPVLPREWGDYFTRVRASALRVEGFNLSTRSDAL